MEIKSGIEQELHQGMSQHQLQSLEILAMDTMELNRFLQNEYMDNPLLEYVGNRQPSWEQFSACEKSTGDHWEQYAPEKEGAGKENEIIQKQLLHQLSRDSFDKRQWELMEYLTECLDDNGFFTMPVWEAADKTGRTVLEVKNALDILRKLEPCGIFSGDLKQCLLKQLEQQGKKDTNLWRIVEGHLDDVASGNIVNISRKLHMKTIDIHKCIQQITELNPRPGMELECGLAAGYVVPDILFKKENGQWEAELNDEWFEDYRVNDYYLSMLKDCRDPQLAEYFQGKLKRVRSIMDSIEQRRCTILSVSQAVIKRQNSYLNRCGPLEPMSMKELAQELGIHISTVSRAVKGRYIQCPWGVLRMRDLFGKAVSEITGGMQISAAQIQEKLRALIGDEDKQHPFSDQNLTELLENMGITVSRRTVTKYRKLMGIKGSHARWK